MPVLRGCCARTLDLLILGPLLCLNCHLQLPTYDWQVRNPYVDPLNVIQAEVLRRLRTDGYDSEEEAQKLRDALVITITGIANGQKNSG